MATETSQVSRISEPEHVLPPHEAVHHQRMRQHLQCEIRQLEKSEYIKPEMRNRLIQRLQWELQRIDDIEQHHQEMQMRMHEHERERLDRFGPSREETTPTTRGVVQDDLKRSTQQCKQEFDKIRAQNGQNLLRQLNLQKQQAEERDSLLRRLDRLLLSALILIVGFVFVRKIWLVVKADIVYRKTAVAYKDACGDRCSCAFCGQVKLPTHAIYHSVFKRTDIRQRTDTLPRLSEYCIDRCGLAVPTCDKCLWRHRLRYLSYRMLIVASVAAWLAFVCFVGFMLVQILPASIIAAGFVMVAFRVIVMKMLVRKMLVRKMLHGWSDFCHPWRSLAGQHPAVAELMKLAYRFDDDWPRFVRKGLDTEDRSRTLVSRVSSHDVEKVHDMYCWMGVLQNFDSVSSTDTRAANSLRYMQDREKRRGTSCTAKDIPLLVLKRILEAWAYLFLVGNVVNIVKMLK